jgi:hypothetical protein
MADRRMRVPASTAIKLQAAACAGGALLCLRLGAAGHRAHSLPQAIRAGAPDTSAGGDHRAEASARPDLAALAYELLDAHLDTTQLTDELITDPSWAAHLDYLRALQRKGREMLARTTAMELASCRWTDPGALDVR